MYAAGIVAEFNPFHSGHAHLISEIRASLGSDTAVVCAMSGNFVQRGDAAIMAKHARAEAAIRCGADLVFELPLPYVLSSADIFAHGAVALLDSLGVITHLAFGAETADSEALKALAEFLYSESGSALIAEKLKSGVSYASACQAAAEIALPGTAELLKSPNNLLAIQYLASLNRLGSGISPLAVQRIGACHDSVETESGFASATHIREMIKAHEDVSPYIPAEAMEIVRREIALGKAPVDISSLDTAILSRLRMLPESAFVSLPGANNGLGLRLKKCCGEPSFEQIADACKSKRFAHSRIRRLLLCAALGIDFSVGFTCPPYARILAANSRGLALLREIGEKSRIPVLTKPASVKELGNEAEKLFALEAAATDLYVLGRSEMSQRSAGEDWRISPVIR